MPFVVRWPARITPGVSADLVPTLDIPATIGAAAGLAVPGDALPDSFNLLPALPGGKDATRRDHLVVMSGNADLALRADPWKYLPDLAVADGWYGTRKKDPAAPARAALFDLSQDPAEQNSLLADRPDEARRLAALLADARSRPATHPRPSPLIAAPGSHPRQSPSPPVPHRIALSPPPAAPPIFSHALRYIMGATSFDLLITTSLIT